jgi:orotate phosphoribosyltransferase
MTREELAKEIYKVSNIRGDFTLRSGIKSTEYFDKYLFEAKPKILSEIAEQMSKLLPDDIDALAGLEMGGVPLATAISLKTGLETLFVRKEAKKYGTCKAAEGGEVKDRNIVIIEDVITSGGAVVNAIKELRQCGADILSVICVIDREASGKANIEKLGIPLKSLFTKSYLDNTEE